MLQPAMTTGSFQREICAGIDERRVMRMIIIARVHIMIEIEIYKMI